MTLSDLVSFSKQHPFSNFDLYIEDASLTENMILVKENKIILSKHRADIGKKCLFNWRDDEVLEGIIIDYALENFLIRAIDTIIAMPPSEVIILEQ